MFLLPRLPGMKETPERRRRKRLVWVALLLILLAAYPAYLGAVRWRAGQLAAEAEQMLQNHQDEMALATARSALGLRPGSIRALRTAAVVLAEQRRPEALPLWREVVARPESVLGDFESGLDAAVGLRAYEAAREFLENGIKRFGDTPSLLRRGASLYETDGDPVRSIQYAQRFLKQHPQDDLVNLILQRQILATGAPSDRAAAKDQVLQIAARNPELRLEALQWIAKLEGLPKEELRKSLQLLDQVPERSLDRLLARADFELKLDPARLSEVARGVFEQGQGLASTAVQLAELGRWFNDRAQSDPVWFERTLTMVAFQRAMADRDLFLVRMDALAGRKHWAEIDGLLARDTLPIEPVLVSLFRIRAKKELGGSGPSEDLWKDLERNLLKQPESSFYVGQYLEKIGESARLEKLYRAVVRIAPRTLAAYAGLVHLAEQRGSLDEVMAILKEATEKDPANDLYKSDYCYLRLLTGRGTEDAAKEAAVLVAAHPENVGFKIPLALAKLTQGDTNGAFALFQSTPLNWAQLTPGQQAVVASVEAGHGSRERAESLAKGIELNRLKPEELALLKQWVAGNPPPR
jgi:tetratricopeptide (TPR) repeat protein